jgi:hypothetical protein
MRRKVLAIAWGWKPGLVDMSPPADIPVEAARLGASGIARIKYHLVSRGKKRLVLSRAVRSKSDAAEVSRARRRLRTMSGFRRLRLRFRCSLEMTARVGSMPGS